MKIPQISTIFFLILSLWGCKETVLDPIEERERANLHFVNLYAPAASLDLRFESYEQDNNIIPDLTFGETWPLKGYASLITLNDPDTANHIKGGVYHHILDHFTGAEIFPKTLFELNPESPTLMALIDDNGTPKVVRALDSFDDFTDSTANLRFMHLSYPFANVTLRNADSTIFVPSMNYLTYTPFKSIPKGNYVLEVIDNATSAVIASTSTVGMSPRKNYAVYFTQVGGSPQIVWEEIIQPK